jgi:hypothetical protein
MGLFSKSKTTVTTLNEIITDSVIKVMKTCSAKAENVISIDAGTVQGDFIIGSVDPKANKTKISQTAVSSINCNQSTEIKAAIKSEIKNGIQAQASTSSNTWLEMPDIGGNSKTITNTTNRDVSNWDVSDIQECGSTSTNKFSIAVELVKGKFVFNQDMEQTAMAEVMECVQNSATIQEKVTKMATEVEAKAASKNVLESIADSLGATLAAIMGTVVMFGAIGLVAMVIVKHMAGKKGAKPTPATT